MRLACPNCDARYEVPDDAIPVGGRDVQCSSCGHAWFQPPALAANAAAQDADQAEGAKPAPAPRLGAFPEGEEDLGEPQYDAPGELAASHAAAPRQSPPPVSRPEPPPPAPPRPVAMQDEADAAAAIARALAEAEDTPAPMAAPPVPKVDLAPETRSILREEAALEADARRQETRRNAMRRADAESQFQTQPELGVDAPSSTLNAAQRRQAMLQGASPETPAPTEAARTARRDLLPDVEEITSTLQPGEDADRAVDNLPDLTRSSAFRNGFLIAVLLLALAATVYALALPIGDMLPGLKAHLASYVTFVDGVRIWLNHTMDAATQLL